MRTKWFRITGSIVMFVSSFAQDRMACAFGALTFAGAAIAAALYPLF